MNISLCLITDPQIARKVRQRLPVIVGESAQIEPSTRNRGISRVDAELRRASSQLADLPGRESDPLKYERPPVAFDRADIHHYRPAGSIEQRHIVGIELRS